MRSALDNSLIESTTLALGREMFDRMSGDRPRFYQSDYWDDFLLRQCMADERLKVQAFRFIDVLPMMHDSADVARHLKEYFAPNRAAHAHAATHSDSHTDAEIDVHHSHAVSELDSYDGHDSGNGASNLRGHATGAHGSSGRSAHASNGNPATAIEALEELDPAGKSAFAKLAARLTDFDRYDSLSARLFAWAARKGAVNMARKFIAGANILQAEQAIRRMRHKRMAFTIDVLGEAALSDDEAWRYHQTYLDLITELPRRAAEWHPVPQIDRADGVDIPRVNVSVKLSSIFPHIDAIDSLGTLRILKERLRPLLRRGIEAGAHIHVDMEHYAIKDVTLAMFREILMEKDFRDYPHFGIVLQAYLLDCERDAAELVAWAKKRGTPIWVRLVKGAYWDTETVLARQQGWPCPVWQHKWQSDACYESVTRMLLSDYRHVHVALASHNVRSLAHGMALQKLWNIPGWAFELQMLYGMGDPIKRAAVDMAQRARIYTPYGDLLPGMAYLIRRLLENTANESFLRHSNAGDVPVETLLRNPIAPSLPTHDVAQDLRRHASFATNRVPQEADFPSETPPATNDDDLDVGLRSHLPQSKFQIPKSEIPQTDVDWRSVPPPEPPIRIRMEFEELLMDAFENAPNTDFTHESNRQQYLAALDQVKTTCGREYPLVIGGKRLTTGHWVNSLNPSRPSEVIGTIAYADAPSAQKAIDVASRAFKDWRWTDPADRADHLFRLARIIARRRFELSALMTLECGKPWREADADTSEAIDFCNYYGHEMVRMAENIRRRDIPGETNEYFYAPRGVVAVISPWNFPLAILTGMTTAALVTGNTVIMKPAGPAAVTAAKLIEMSEEAGLPPGVLNYLPGPGSLVGEVLVKHPNVAMIAFTGSREIGCRINRLAAEHHTSAPSLKKVIAEMGGKNAIIVDADADLDEAIKAVLYSAFGYAGQKCSACSRAIVLESIHDRFLQRLVEAARSLSIGPADDPATFIPPVIDKPAFDNIRRMIGQAKSDCSSALEIDTSDLIARTGGGYYIGPTIFSDVPPTAPIARDEVFGPVLAVIKARDFDHALEIFNNTDFALTGGIFSRSPANLDRARRVCECGNLYVNRRITGAIVDLQPFGGFKMSGIGSKAGGPDYLIQFCEPRCITENTLRRGFAPADDAGERR